MSLGDAHAFGQHSHLLPQICQETWHLAGENVLPHCVLAVRGQQMLLGGAGARQRNQL